MKFDSRPERVFESVLIFVPGLGVFCMYSYLKMACLTQKEC